MNLHMLGKLLCAISTLNTRLTHGTETENKGQKIGVDYRQRKKKQNCNILGGLAEFATFRDKESQLIIPQSS